jgi:hypothetical protein
MVNHPWIRREFVSGHRDHAHRFGPAGDHNLRAPGTYPVSRHGNGLQSRRAEAVNRDAGDRIGQAGSQSCDSRHIHAGFAFRIGAAEDDVVYFVAGDSGIFFEQAADYSRGQIVRAGGAQSAFGRFSDGGAETIDYYSVHRIIPLHSHECERGTQERVRHKRLIPQWFSCL